jgi:hypothetical protein
MQEKSVPKALVEDSDRCYKEMCESLRRTAKAAADWGKVLLEIRKMTKRGAWESWFREHYDLSPDTALRYMWLAEKWEKVEPYWQENPRLTHNQALKLLRRLSGNERKPSAPGAGQKAPEPHEPEPPKSSRVNLAVQRSAPIRDLMYGGPEDKGRLLGLNVKRLKQAVDDYRVIEARWAYERGLLEELLRRKTASTPP